MPVNQFGQTVIDPRAQLLLGRAMRQEPIDTGMSLIGRLAALGVGQSQQRGFEQEVADSRLGYSQALQQAGTDPTARLAVLSQGAASPDPQVRADALKQIATLTTPETRMVGTPGGGQAAVQLQGGRVAGVQPVVAGLAQAPEMFTFKDGESERTLMFDPQAGGMVDMATAPREVLERTLPPEVFNQQMELRTAAGRAQGEATGAALAGVTDKSAAQAAGGVLGRAETTIALTLPVFNAAEAAIQSATKALRANPGSREAAAAYEVALDAYAGTVAQLRFPNEAVTDDATRGVKQAMPSARAVAGWNMVGSDPVSAALDSVRASLGPRGGEAPAVAAGMKAPTEMTDDELRAEIERLRGGK